MPSRFKIAFERRRLATKRAFFRLRTKITGDSRPSSNPFISGDGFRKLARFKFDSIGDIENAANPSIGGVASDLKKDDVTFEVDRGDVIFVASPIIKDFFEKAHPKISNPYILITHNGDTNIGKDLSGYIDGKIIRWFAQNVLVEHPKLTPIPIGLENLHYYQNGIVSLFRSTRRMIERRGSSDNADACDYGSSRKARILYHFKVRTNPNARQPALDYFSRHPLAETMENKLSPRFYQKKISSYMFVASPPGNGEDCIRTWEAMYLGVIPIVKRSVGIDYFKRLGLPMLVVDEWTDLDTFDENKLHTTYEKTMKEARTEALYVDHWTKLIAAARTSNK